jgi:PKD repeat protein
LTAKALIGFIVCLLLISQLIVISLAVDPDNNNNSGDQSLNDTRANETKKWTVMIYMAADNNLEYYGVSDMNEMEKVGSSEDVNIIVQFDRHPGSSVSAGYTSSNGDWDETKRFYIEHDEDNTNFYDYVENENMWSLGETNMAAQSTFNNFMNWAIGNFTAENYLLVMWNHGEDFFSGARGGRSSDTSNDEQETKSETGTEKTGTRGVCNDETNRGWLTLKEMRNVLKDTTANYGTKIDIISYDVCWAGTVETAYELMPYADYFAGSQEEEPNPGWDYYRPMSTLVNNPDISPGDLAIKITKDFREEYKDGQNIEDQYMTFTAVDLDRFENYFIPILNDFAEVMSKNIYDYYNIINNARSNTDKPRRSGKEYLRDFFHFTDLIYKEESAPVELREAAKSVLNEYNNTIIKFVHGSKHPNAKGLYIYFPKNDYNTVYDSKLFFSTEHWDEFIKLFITPIQITHKPLNDTEVKTGEFTINAVIKGYSLDSENVYLFYNDSKTDTISPVQMMDTGENNIFKTEITIFNFDTRVYYYIRATDDYGELITSPITMDMGDASTWHTFYIGEDNTPPSIDHIQARDIIADAQGSPYEFYMNITDNLGINSGSLFLWYNINNSDTYDSVPLKLWDYPDQYYCILPAHPANTIIYYYITASDTAGSPNNARAPESGNFEFNVSRIKPNAAFSMDKTITDSYSFITFTSTSQPKSEIVSYHWNFGDNSAIGNKKVEIHQYTRPGIYRITLQVVHSNGLSDVEYRYVEILNSPPEAKINSQTILINSEERYIDYNNMIVGLVFEDDIIEIDCAQSNDMDGYILKWSWSFGDGNIYDEICEDLDGDGTIDPTIDRVIPILTKMSVIDLEERLNSSKNGKIRYKYIQEGNYTIRFSATDNDETVSAVQELKLTVANDPPEVDPDFKSDGLTVKFDAHKNGNASIDTPSDQRFLNFTWDFGDGDMDYSINPTHTYSDYDRYTVTLTVTDDDGELVTESFEVNLKEENDNSLLFIGLGLIVVLIIIIITLIGLAMAKNRARRASRERQQPEIESRTKMDSGTYKSSQSADIRLGHEKNIRQPIKESPRGERKFTDTRTSRPIKTAKSQSDSADSDGKVQVKDLMSMIKQK